MHAGKRGGSQGSRDLSRKKVRNLGKESGLLHVTHEVPFRGATGSCLHDYETNLVLWLRKCHLEERGSRQRSEAFRGEIDSAPVRTVMAPWSLPKVTDECGQCKEGRQRVSG